MTLLLPDDPAHPIDSDTLVSCGSYDARFELSVPPGRYRIYGNDARPDVLNSWEKELDLTHSAGVVDVGALARTGSEPYPEERVKRARAEGRWVELADRYGKPAPDWSLADARGISRTARIRDFKGKWLLVYVWGFSCVPCLNSGLPDLTRFYEEHAADRERFEIVAVCLSDRLASIEAVDAKLAPIVKNAWKGKALPFPIALDVTDRTMEDFGFVGLGAHLLIDPEGNLVKGDATMLAEKLKARE